MHGSQRGPCQRPRLLRQLTYTKQTWSDFPDTSTPITAARLSHIEQGLHSSAWYADANAVADYGADPSGSADSTSAIQDAIDDCPEGGTVVLPRGTYKLTDAIVIDKAMSLVGAGAHELYGTMEYAEQTTNLPLESPFISGTVLHQTGAGKDGVQVTAVGRGVHLRDFGVRFADEIRWANTGHGINAIPPTRTTGRNHGVFSGKWSNIVVWGHDGNHYGFQVVNTLYCTFEHLRSFGGGGFLFESNKDINNGGFVATHLYCVVFAGGTAHGFRLKNTRQQTNGILFNRPQCWTLNLSTELDTLFGSHPTPASTSQKMFYCDANVPWLTVLQADFETEFNYNGAGIVLPTAPAYGGMTWFDPASIIPSNETPGVVNLIAQLGTETGRKIDFQMNELITKTDSSLTPTNGVVSRFTDNASSRVFGYQADGRRIWRLPRIAVIADAVTASAGTEAGSSAPAPALTGSGRPSANDGRGQITFGTGTGAQAGEMVAVLFSRVLNNEATVVLTPVNSATAELGLFVSSVSASGFSVSCANDPSSSQGNTIYGFNYAVIG